MMSADHDACENTDREIWREREGDFYADSIHVTQDGGIGMNVGGTVIVMPIYEWFALATGATRIAVPTPTVDDTLDFITKAHSGQVDKIGEPYWKHPARVMARIPNATDHERVVALLHDVLEDTRYTALDLLKMGYPFDVVWDVNTLTKPTNHATLYRHRIQTIAALGSQAAIRVKIADIEDNLDPPRFSKLQEQDQQRLGAKYRGAIEILRAALTTGNKTNG